MYVRLRPGLLAVDAHDPEVELKSLDTDDSLPEDQ